MSTPQERRAPSASRVSLETLVEICGNEPGIPAFEAEAVDVSARGMHLKTAYLPDSGAPLVCRFENGGKEIVVEGVVAWRKESARGGEFGVKFTALDSRSVDALRGLVAQNLKQDSAEGAPGAGAGTRVRLHIEGLGSPMKARVRGGGSAKLEVGSNLEFLKVGRKLEIEDLEAGARRTALIDGVDVVIDPSTQVPQLVVALRYEGMEEDTPLPAVTDLSAAPEPAPEHLHLTPGSVTTSADPEPSDELPPARAAVDAALNDGDIEQDESAESPQVRLGKLAGAAGEVAGAAGGALKRAGAGAWRGVGQLFQGAGSKIAALRSKDASKGPKRTTAAPPAGPVSIEGKRVRQQQPSASSEAVKSNALTALKNLPPKKKLAVGAGASVVLVSVLALALKPASSPPPGAAAAGEPATVSVQGAPSGAPAAAALPGDPVAAPAGSGVNANVPLFGPTPMATLEPAPLGPVPQEEAEELAEAKASVKEAEAAVDEEFSDEPARPSKPTSSSKKAVKAEKPEPEAAPSKRPEDVAPWGRGKMHLPTIHRLRLDEPGAEIRGANEPTGFTVLIPGRKVMEKGSALAKRDARIARVRTTNTPGGAQLRVEFKDGTPAYRVRLRKDYVEVLISASTSTEKKK